MTGWSPILLVQVGSLSENIVSAENHAFRWISEPEFDDLQPPMSGAVKWSCREALAEVRSTAVQIFVRALLTTGLRLGCGCEGYDLPAL